MQQSGGIIYLVDDDVSVREAMAGLLASMDFKVISFESAETFLRHERADTAACLILDLQLPKMNGLDLQRRLGQSANLPIIFISGHGDIPSSVRAIKGGAIEFLTKPVDSHALITAIRAALDADREARARQADLAELRERLSLLSPREREVLPLIVAGYLTKQVAGQLGISEVTVQIHRGRIMRKMAASSFADLVRKCAIIGIPDTAGERPTRLHSDAPPSGSLP